MQENGILITSNHFEKVNKEYILIFGHYEGVFIIIYAYIHSYIKSKSIHHSNVIYAFNYTGSWFTMFLGPSR